jgi:hypothetical protein
MLNPYLFSLIDDISLIDLARLLNTRADWLEQYERLRIHPLIIRRLNHLRSLPHYTSEAYIQANFNSFATSLADNLEIPTFNADQTSFCVGGILARHELDIFGRSDIIITNVLGRALISTEIKTMKKLPSNGPWYHGSRGVQVFSALYSYNCPTILFNQSRWNLFVENSERNSVMMLSSDTSSEPKSTCTEEIDDDFLKALVICILSERKSLTHVEGEASSKCEVAHQVPNPEQPTPSNVGNESSSADASAGDNNHHISPINIEKQPSFVSGFENGLPVYTTIRIYTGDDVAKIEEEISEEKRNEKDSFIKQESDTTLVE